jgi:flagellar hook-associated protein 2
VDGQDAEILMNGAKFTSLTNSFTINDLSFKVMETTANEVTLTTQDDTDGIYDMIKNFFSEYNKLINEIDSLYNADSASDYEPLTSDEKDAMTDSEVEDWEEKIKSALLRRDSTLASVGDAMKNILLQGVSVNGKQMYLSDFGINTLGYFTAAENEKNAYHIDGNSDDENSTVRSSDDVLKSMIASDPDTVMDFFTGLANNLHDSLLNQMSASSLSSAFTVYNDKQMSDEYDDYTDKISAQEDKLNDLIDKWYDKFSTMETALAKLDSKSSSLSSLLGG